MFIDLEFNACLLSCKSQDYTFDDGKTVTGYRVGIMLEDGECGMVKCTADAVPPNIDYRQDYVFKGRLNTDKGTFKIVSVESIG